MKLCLVKMIMAPIATTIDLYQGVAILAVLVCQLTACTSDVQSNAERIKALNLGSLPEVPYPLDDPKNADQELLGKLLFWDPILSGQRDVACASCHLPEYGYGDGLDLSIGVGGIGAGIERIQSDITIPLTRRNAPTIINAAFNGLLNEEQTYDTKNAIMFWDGRSQSLESQCLGPLASFNTMRGRAYSAEAANDSILKRLRNIPEYVQRFNNAFGGDQSITIENLSRAIASFERSINNNNTPYDQYVRGDLTALSTEQEEGLLLFFGKAYCSSCHSGPMFSDYNYYNLGIPFNSKIPADSGRQSAFLFRTPTLRNASITSPYMHNGVYATLEEVLDHYSDGISKNPAISRIDKKMKPLNLTQAEKKAIISFIESLTDNQFDKSRPADVPSGLTPGGNL